jgi:hypothetical protein
MSFNWLIDMWSSGVPRGIIEDWQSSNELTVGMILLIVVEATDISTSYSSLLADRRFFLHLHSTLLPTVQTANAERSFKTLTLNQ